MQYDKTTILGLKLRSAVQLRKLTRLELLTRMQLLPVIDPITDEAYKAVEEEKWRKQTDDSPHGHPWHVSFHGSQFPGDDPLACPRESLYRMMDFPAAKPFNRAGRTVMSAGKAIEVELVQTWADAGILLSAAPTEEVQTGFEVEEAWLTSSVDSVILPPRWNKPLPIEIKTKYQKDIDQMKLGMRGPDAKHVIQCKVQVALVRSFQSELWPGLDPVTHGYIYYLSRDRPTETAEFRVDYDPKFFELGLERLKRWRAMFEEGVLPEQDPGKRESKFGHPNGKTFKWSKLPCQWCDFKDTCQKDFRAGITDLMESHGIEKAKEIRPHYDPQAARDRVFARWRASDKIAASSGERN